MPKELDKAYEPKKFEDGIYKRWEESGFFNPDVCVEKGVTAPDAEPFTIVLPPPNVTGTLHMGHAAMLAIEDCMIRYHRMKGDRTLWIPGTDHAAIATQSKVEKILLDTEGKTRHDLGREAFLKLVDQFAKESRDTIVNQSKKMGSSLDWSREAYTLDATRNKAVRTVFKKMYDDEVIYRGDRLVNWDPKMQSNVSDDEIEWKEEKTPFYYFQYGPFVIATARPETKFGDKYVVMHPEDERYTQYKHGDTFECEWINGKITATIIKDQAIDMEFGSGVMTITPWHDAVDFDMAERHKLDKEQVIDLDGKLLAIAGEFVGMDAREARTKIVEKLQSKGLIVKVEEDYVHNIAINYRGGGVIEPQIRKQWFIDVNKKVETHGAKIPALNGNLSLKERMQIVVREGNIEILPERFDKTYFHWIDNLRDWCISRQIWFGHQIPVWYKGEEMYVGVEAPEGEGWKQDPDTLDTWFSSGLWTFSTLGWPDNTKDLQTFHPTSVLETGYDILFFWVARMILMTTYVLGDVPFKTVYLHGLVRDEQGRKMSKSLGNIIDPLDMIEKYGTDATRLSLLLGSTPGNDMKLSEEKIAGFRNFTNKLWNMSRFMLLNISDPKKDIAKPEAKTLSDRWILSRLNQVIFESVNDLEKYNLSSAGERLRDFTWGDLADWYLEIAKIEGEKQDILNYLLNSILKLWHPFMPYVTETLWKEIYGEENILMVEKYPVVQGSPSGDDQIPFFTLQRIVTQIRALRTEYKIEPAKKIKANFVVKDISSIEENKAIYLRLVNLEDLQINAEKTEGSISFVESGVEVHLDFSSAVDIEKEKARLEKEIATVAPYVTSLEAKLAGDFATSAPAPIVEKERTKLAEAKEKLQKLQEQLSHLEK